MDFKFRGTPTAAAANKQQQQQSKALEGLTIEQKKHLGQYGADSIALPGQTIP